MLNDRIERSWIEAFRQTFALCAVRKDEPSVILCETQSRPFAIHLAELALLESGLRPVRITLPTPPPASPVPIRSTGASRALGGNAVALAALREAGFVVDLTLEGMLHAPELPAILESGARLLMVSNEHPEALARLVPDPALMPKVKAAVKRCRAARHMQVRSAAGTDLAIDMTGAVTVGVWGYCDRPGTVAHWPGGVVVSFPRASTVNGVLVLDEGDINLTFKRYLRSPVTLTIEDDHVTGIAGRGTEAELMRRYLAAFGDREAYAVSHVGFGMNPAARYEALTMYDQRETNGTELRAVAGNFLFSTGANEFAGRFTEGHFDIPVMNCTIELDGEAVVEEGRLAEEFA
ncbi:MAG: 2,5-dihydroxypyridine 5,6-dioxygenase [Geminicoccaceae bacterium]